MSSPSFLRSRWLGWTVVYGLAVVGILRGAAALHFSEPWLAPVVGLLLAALIGFRFRSWRWVLGALAAIGLPAAALIVVFLVQAGTASTEGARMAAGMMVGLVLLSLAGYALAGARAAAVGVWVGQWWYRRQQSE